MSEEGARFVDQTGLTTPALDLWPALLVPKEAIDAEVSRLAELPAPPNGRRSAAIVHPRAQAPGLGLAPGIRVSLDVLKPGEQTTPIRHNSTQVNFCIQGGGYAVVGGRRIGFECYDVWNIPSMHTYWHVNDGAMLQVRLTYSNAALLEKMNVHVVDQNPPESRARQLDAPSGSAAARTNPFGTLQLTADGAYLMPYEQLINPAPVESKALHWPWQMVKAHLDKLATLGEAYVGRRLYLLFNPATGRTNGTTQNFFATITVRPPHIADRAHRHTSAAINYFFAGRGRSVVEGKTYEWKAGDLMLSAPGWGLHNHASGDEPVYELTIQDSPLNIAMESLLWQEALDGPVAVLGAEQGFSTNRSNG
jgi:gentisate 1,2-dioxygenase